MPAHGEEPDPDETRAIMQEVFAALQTVLPPSLDEKRFADPARRPEIHAALRTLSQNAGRLSAHASSSGPAFAFLSRSLAREANEIERRYAAGRFREAQFELHEFTENCVACHSRLPDPQDSALSSRFMDESEIAALPLPERAQLAMATRQFERALAAQEAMLTSREFDVSSIDLLGYLDDYLEVCVRVKADFERPARTLEAFAKRPDIREGLRNDVQHWVTDLRALSKGGPVEGFEAGRRMAQEAESAVAKLGERKLTVRYQAASGALHRFVAAAPRGDRARGGGLLLAGRDRVAGRAHVLAVADRALPRGGDPAGARPADRKAGLRAARGFRRGVATAARREITCPKM